MTKTRSKPAAVAKPAATGYRKPQWLKDLGLDSTWDGLWYVINQESPDQLRKRFMNLRSRADWADQKIAELSRLRQEESEFYQRELAATKQANLGRIQSNLLQTLQSMMATMEGNSRAVHALAVPVGDLLEQLGKELREGKGQQK